MPLEGIRGNRKKSEVNIRQIEIDDIGSVYHLGEQLEFLLRVPLPRRQLSEYLRRPRR